MCVWKGGLVYVGLLRESGEYMVGRPDFIDAESSLEDVGGASVGCGDAADEDEGTEKAEAASLKLAALISADMAFVAGSEIFAPEYEFL